MKRKLLFLALLFVGLVGCTYNTLPDDVATPIVATEQGFDLSFATRAEVFDGQSLDNKYFVAEEDLESFLNYKQQHSDKKIIVKDCTPYGFDGSHTLFYVLNYADGWEVVSADKRTQATLAYGEGERAFSMGADNTNEAEKFWMELLASDVLQKRQRNKSQATRSDDAVVEIANDEEQARVNYWNRICTNGTRAIEIDSPSALPNHWYILGTTIDSIKNTKGPHTVTKWGQGWPWNVHCPTKPNGNGNAYVGCVAVAGGQLLYYLRHKTHVQMFIPVDVIDVTGTYNNYQYTFSNTISDAVWSAMAKNSSEYLGIQDDPTELVATLLSWVGDGANMSYKDTGSSAYSSTLFNWMRNEFGITRSVCSYSASVLKQELYENQEPIYIEGRRITGYDENGNQKTSGHAWLADGFKTETRVDTVYYLVTEEEMTTEELTQCSIEDATHFIKYELEDAYVHMNWGWDGSRDNVYYSIVKSGRSPNSTPYELSVNFYYDFNI